MTLFDVEEVRAKRRMHAKEEHLNKVAIAVELTHEYTVDEIETPV
jgi:hypothetical protein